MLIYFLGQGWASNLCSVPAGSHWTAHLIASTVQRNWPSAHPTLCTGRGSSEKRVQSCSEVAEATSLPIITHRTQWAYLWHRKVIILVDLRLTASFTTDSEYRNKSNCKDVRLDREWNDEAERSASFSRASCIYLLALTNVASTPLSWTPVIRYCEIRASFLVYRWYAKGARIPRLIGSILSFCSVTSLFTSKITAGDRFCYGQALQLSS